MQKNVNNFIPAKCFFETVSCANCLIFIDFAIKSTRLLTGVALAMSLSDTFAVGRGRREFTWGQAHPKRVFLQAGRAAVQRGVCGGLLSSEKPWRAGKGQ